MQRWNVEYYDLTNYDERLRESLGLHASDESLLKIRGGDGSILPIGASYDSVHTNGIIHDTSDIILVTEVGTIVLQQRRTDLGYGSITLSAGGHLNVGEDPKSAVLRELREELSLELDPHDVICVTAMECGMPLYFETIAVDDCSCGKKPYAYRHAKDAEFILCNSNTDGYSILPQCKLQEWRWRRCIFNQELCYYYIALVSNAAYRNIAPNVREVKDIFTVSIEELYQYAMDEGSMNDTMQCLIMHNLFPVIDKFARERR